MPVLNSLVIAFATYSRLPMPAVDASAQNRKYVLCFFPLVGVVIGALMMFWLWLCEALRLGLLLKGTIGAALPLLITGGIHMDGFMDTVDALASWGTQARRLEILKDSHIGAFASIRCITYFAVMSGLLSEGTWEIAPCIAVIFLASRAVSAGTSVLFVQARSEGMLASTTQPAQKQSVIVSGAVYIVVCSAVWLLHGAWIMALCLATLIVCVLYYKRMAYQKFGGVTGDLAGWLSQIVELFCIAAVILGGKLL